MILNIIGKYILVSIVICLLYGLNVLSIVAIRKFYKKDFNGSYLFQSWSFIVFLILWHLSSWKISVFDVHSLWNLKNIILICLSVIPTSIMVSKGKKEYIMPIKNFLSGASMEIPQRLLTQNLFTVLGINVVVYGELTGEIFLNALIWVQFIIVQEIINKKKFSSKIALDIAASFWFSIWVGILYNITGNIIITMIAHGLQRITTHEVRKRLENIDNNKPFRQKV